MPSTATQTISLPGFGLPLKSQPDFTHRFPTALQDVFRRHEAAILTVRESTMMEIMNRLTDKPNWNEKIFNEKIVGKWRAEILRTPNQDVSEKMIDWCIAEIKYKAQLFIETRCIETLDGVYKSDIIVPVVLKQALQRAVAPLEDVPTEDKDWHPGSHQQVLDLVHPSIYPLVYGQSRILPTGTVGLSDCVQRCGEGQTVVLPKQDPAEDLGPLRESYSPSGLTDNPWSNKYQWLPAEFMTPEGTEDVNITSYINSLHPKHHKDLYAVIERVVAKAIPLWNQTLHNFFHSRAPVRIELDEKQGYDVSGEPKRRRGERNPAFEARYHAWRDARPVLQPEPGTFETPEERSWNLWKKDQEAVKIEGEPLDEDREGFLNIRARGMVDLRKDFGKLQIIVKLANIHLTPEKPSYGGGSWHVEGQANEAICATALYYYDSTNVSESLLAFRQQVGYGTDLPYEQGDFRAIEEIYGFRNGEPCVQELGKVVTKEGRLLTFPNTIQHRVHPFHLTDPSKPGHRKILALFLVDPHQPIISTANIPCQQKAWWQELIRGIGPLGQIPPEVAAHIINLTDDFPVSWDVAKAQRRELMEERRHFVLKHTETFVENTFSLCEH